MKYKMDVVKVFKKKKLSYDLAIPPLSIYSKEMNLLSYRYRCIPMLIPASFIVTKH